MADTLQNISIPPEVWLNIYTHPTIVAAGITVGTQISAQNLGSNNLLVHAGVDAPTEADGFRSIKPGDVWSNDAGDSGAWILSKVVTGLTNVRAE